MWNYVYKTEIEAQWQNTCQHQSKYERNFPSYSCLSSLETKNGVCFLHQYSELIQRIHKYSMEINRVISLESRPNSNQINSKFPELNEISRKWNKSKFLEVGLFFGWNFFHFSHGDSDRTPKWTWKTCTPRKNYITGHSKQEEREKSIQQTNKKERNINKNNIV